MEREQYQQVAVVAGALAVPELAEIEQQIDEILKVELEKCSSGKLDSGEMGATSLASQRLQYLMAQRRLTLNGASAALLRDNHHQLMLARGIKG
jgi:hypothetical protein